MPSAESQPSFREALRFWLRLGFISFGGPAGQIAIMHTELVDRKKWIDDQQFLHALNFCMLLPGPEATQLAIYCGWLLHRARGGIVAGVLFVLPGVAVLWALSFVYVAFGHVAWISAVFYGLKPAVTAIVAAAVIRIGRRALKRAAMWAIAAAAFVAIYFFRAPFPAIVVAAGAIGIVGAKWRPLSSTGLVNDESAKQGSVKTMRPTFARAIKVTGVCVVLWFTPIVIAGFAHGWNGTLAREGFFFSKAAMVTFGGAYAVLPYVGQQAVENYHWLTAPQMLDGLGLAETTPGPLIMVVQFVGFLGGWNHPGGLNALVAATLGSAITTWATFVPCFLWIFLGAPHIEQLRGNARLGGALAAVTAAVVGVILNLAVWFGRQTFFPVLGVVDWFAIAAGTAAFAAMQWRNVGIVPVVVASGALGLVWRIML